MPTHLAILHKPGLQDTIVVVSQHLDQLAWEFFTQEHAGAEPKRPRGVPRHPGQNKKLVITPLCPPYRHPPAQNSGTPSGPNSARWKAQDAAGVHEAYPRSFHAVVVYARNRIDASSFLLPPFPLSSSLPIATCLSHILHAVSPLRMLAEIVTPRRRDSYFAPKFFCSSLS